MTNIHCSGCELAHLGIFTHSLLSFTELWPLICENLDQKVCFTPISETIGTTDLKLHGYIVQGVNLRTLVFSFIGCYHLQIYGP